MGKEEKKEKGEEIKGKRKEEKKVTSSIYKVYLHCPKCSNDIKKLLLSTPGVQNVDVKFEKNEITVKGIIDEKKIHKRMEKVSRKVEIVPPPAPPKEKEKKKEKEKGKEIEKVVKETKVTVQTTTIKAYMHCNKCEHDLRTKLLSKKGICDVKTDMKAQTIVIKGTIESKKLLNYMKSVQKHAEIVPPKEEKREKENVKEKVEVKSTETTKIVEFKEEIKVKAKTPDENVPYFVHYVYAPQLFSDENPNACFIM